MSASPSSSPARKRPPPQEIDLLSPSPSPPHCKKKACRISDSSISIIDLGDDDEDEVRLIVPKKKKSVHFDDIEHEVYYFQPYPVELQDYESSSSPTKNKRTAEYTVLSSQHGRARRLLRNISKSDLRAAVKHGIQSSAHPSRNGEPRYKFTYNNVVYITDASRRREITSYVESIKIDRHPISNDRMRRHEYMSRLISDQPQLCTGHTYVIIDQSGSMRQSDVNGFPSRSHAAYGTLALDFVAEQLSSTSSGNVEMMESISIIEMRNEPEIVIDRKPFDWILFNSLIDRPTKSYPRSHGNFNPSLLLVKNRIVKEYTALLMDKEVEKDELPHFNVVFLSDGKPSDGYQSHQSRADVVKFDTERVEILKELSALLGNKLYFYAMGVGSSTTMEFKALSDMVDVVKNGGGSGRFVHAGLDAVAMGNSFSAISNTMTSLRTDLLTGGGSDGGGGRSVVNMEKKDFSLRETGKIVGKVFEMEKYINGKNYSIKRFRWDRALHKKGQSPWKDVGFAAHGANGFAMEKKALGEGAERLAYRFNEIKYNSETNTYKQVGKLMVAKNSILANEKETKEHFHSDFCRVQSKAYDLAEKFNHAVRTATRLKSVSEDTRPPELKFVMCHVYTYKNLKTNEETALLVERFLNGKFTKYNSNNGYVKQAIDGVNNTRTIELVSGKARLEEFLQAFSHWVYVQSNCHMVVCDLQGVLNEEGRYPEFLLTDPAICTSSSKSGSRYGKTDMKLNGIRRFISTHRCGIVCRGLGLPCLTASSLDNDDGKRQAI